MIYGYIRVSTDKQTVENQRLEITEWSAKRSLNIDTWMEQTCSGTKNYKKGAFRNLILTKLQKGDTLIVSELSRLSRSLFEIMEILKTLMEREVNVKTVKEGYELGDNITSKVLAFAFGLSAEIERNLISERTKAGLRRTVEQNGTILGRPIGTRNKFSICDKNNSKIQELIDKGISSSGIARIIGVHRLTVASYVRKLAIRDLDAEIQTEHIKENRGKFTLVNINAMKLKGLSINEIAKNYDMSTTAFYKNLRKLSGTQVPKPN